MLEPIGPKRWFKRGEELASELRRFTRLCGMVGTGFALLGNNAAFAQVGLLVAILAQLTIIAAKLNREAKETT